MNLQETLQSVENNCFLLLYLFFDIIDYTNILNKYFKLNIKKTNILQIITDLKKILEFIAKKKKIELEFTINLSENKFTL